MTALLLILVFLLFQTFVLLCCVAAGNDAASQEISDQEQMEYIQTWMKKKGKSFITKPAYSQPHQQGCP